MIYRGKSALTDKSANRKRLIIYRSDNCLKNFATFIIAAVALQSAFWKPVGIVMGSTTGRVLYNK